MATSAETIAAQEQREDTRRRYTTINGYPIDAVETEEHSHESDVTQHPVEKGADIADNVRVMPDSFTLECTVSDTPIGQMATLRATETAAGTGGLRGVPSDDAYARLLAIRDAREPVTVVTSRRRYDSVVLKSLTVPRRAANSGGLKFRASFVQVIVVENLRTTVPVATPGGQAKNGLGHRPSSPFKDLLATLPTVAYDPTQFTFHLVGGVANAQVANAETQRAAQQAQLNRNLGLAPDATEEQQANRLNDLGLSPARFDPAGNLVGYGLP